MAKPPSTPKTVEALQHREDRRVNIPTAEHQSMVEKSQEASRKLRYPRNPDLDPQLVWRGKDEQDWSDLVVQAPPLFIQEKVHPKALIDDLLRRTEEGKPSAPASQLDLFADFNGIPEGADKTEFYAHDQNWTNRMILGDSLQVMASLAEREGLRGKVQCIYLDPPYGIKFNSNFQWSTTDRDVKDGKAAHITREPEQVKAFRDTWRDGIHSYLTYLRDRFTVARDLLSDSGSIFVQIGDENVHRVRAVLDEVFGERNYVSIISLQKTAARSSQYIQNVSDYVIWYGKDASLTKFRKIVNDRELDAKLQGQYPLVYLPSGDLSDASKDITASDKEDLARPVVMTSSHEYSRGKESIQFQGKSVGPGSRYWSTSPEGIYRVGKASRLVLGGATVYFVRRLSDYPYLEINNTWTDVATGGGSDRLYVVQTVPKVIQRCILMSTDPGDLVLDPTCGSGTTAYVAEQWGRRWITIDTSRVALALARARIMGARYPYFLLADTKDGQMKEAELSRRAYVEKRTYGNVRQGFVYERVPHITLKSIANNAEIDVIWDKWQQTLEPLREKLNAALGKSWQEWEIPREVDGKWPDEVKKLHADWWQARIDRQKEMDASIAAKAEYEFLYDKPCEDKKKVRVAGPFTVESLSPHRVLGVDENDELIDPLVASNGGTRAEGSFDQMILENLKTSGVQQAHKEDRITFTSLTPWPGSFVCAEGRYSEGTAEKRAAIFIGPEFGTVSRADLVEASREALDAGFDVLISCAFNYEAHTTEFTKLGRLPVLKARMNADLHMSDDLKNTGKGNLFVIFGEPDIEVLPQPDGQIKVQVRGVDVFDPSTGEVRSDNADGIACWFLDTDYNEESFFVRHAYFLGANDPYGALKTTLKAEIDAEAWATLNSDTSRAFKRPIGGRIAVKVINNLGDEVMKVFRV